MIKTILLMIKANFAIAIRIVILHQDHHPGGKAMS